MPIERHPRSLAGIRVLDLPTMIAAPIAATVLGDSGASITKIEQPGTGDHARHYGRLRRGHGIYWRSLGRNRRGVTFDLHNPIVQELVLRWIRQYDVLIENFRPARARPVRRSSLASPKSVAILGTFCAKSWNSTRRRS